MSKLAAEETRRKVLCAVQHSILRLCPEHWDFFCYVVLEEVPVLDAETDAEVEKFFSTKRRQELSAEFVLPIIQESQIP